MKKAILLICALLLSGCDEVINFKYSADRRDNSNLIQGRVTDIQTGMFIPEAAVKIGIYEVLADQLGYYKIRYEIGTDENRNQAIPISVSAFNYVSVSDSLFPFPGVTDFSPKLLFAAPIFDFVESRRYDAQEWELFAHIRDNQGYETIQTVYAEIFYITERMGGRKEIIHQMQFLRNLDEVTGEYRCEFPTFLENGVWSHDGRFRIHAIDEDGHYRLFYQK